MSLVRQKYQLEEKWVTLLNPSPSHPNAMAIQQELYLARELLNRISDDDTYASAWEELTQAVKHVEQAEHLYWHKD